MLEVFFTSGIFIYLHSDLYKNSFILKKFFVFLAFKSVPVTDFNC
ncbi:Photosystem II reaction center protein K (fragment) [Elizabethkingia anophelis]